MSPAALYLYVAAAVAGACIMSTEMAAQRLLVPFYGDSHLIWANLIGLVLAALTAGYYLGGKLADRGPTLRRLASLLAISGLWILVVPLVSRPLLTLVQGALPTSQAGFVVSSFLSIIILVALPLFLLGCVSPFVIRLALLDVRNAGNVAGSMYAISTVGSMAGTFGAALWLMPDFGVRATFLVTATLLLVTAAAALPLPRRVLTARPERIAS